MALFRRKRDTPGPQATSDPAVSSGTREATERSRSRRSLLPPGIVAEMAELGLAEYRQEYDFFQPRPYESRLKTLPRDMQEAWVAALSEEALAAGGWAVCGAQYVVERAMLHPVELPAYRAMLDAALDFERAAGLWWSHLSGHEKRYWQEQHGNEPWQTPREQPSREHAAITPLPVGEERKISVATNKPDSNVVYVKHLVDGTYIWLLEYPDESGAAGARLREERWSAEDLYELYSGLAPFTVAPGYWVDPEFEAFFEFPGPRI